MAKWIKTNGETIEVNPKNGTDYSLEELQGFVGGYIEIIEINIGFAKGKLMVVNEEGKIDGLPLNTMATLIAGQAIVGNVLVCKPGEVK